VVVPERLANSRKVASPFSWAAHEKSKVPSPLETQELRDWAARWADSLLELHAEPAVAARRATPRKRGRTVKQTD